MAYRQKPIDYNLSEIIELFNLGIGIFYFKDNRLQLQIWELKKHYFGEWCFFEIQGYPEMSYKLKNIENMILVKAIIEEPKEKKLCVM